MKSIVLLFILLMSAGYSWSQNHEQNYSDRNTPSKDQSSIAYKVEVGTSISNSNSFGNSILFYTKPEIKYRLSPKLEVNTGLILTSSSISSYYQVHKKYGQNYNAYLSAGLSYNPTQKLRLTGEILYGMNKGNFSQFEKNTSPEYILRFNAEYKITDNFSVGFQVINQNLNYLNMSYPFGNNLLFPDSRYNQFYGY